MTLPARAIRKAFLDFFASYKHAVVASNSLVPHDDPTLFFTNAGMVQFKNLFLGTEKREYTRATTSQKCLRVAGKHNDLEEVGRTPRHHTLFEMLGNFSFGDYFKTEAIAFAWELLTNVYGIPANRLVATVFEHDDDAAKLWEVHLPPARIFRFGEKDNFWAMGETGPCGPCSELHYDWEPDQGAPTKADVESGRFWEIWNLVFMQFNRGADGVLTPLAKPSIDTGMGLERITAVLQGKRSNYDTDLFAPIIRTIEELTGKQYVSNELPMPSGPLPAVTASQELQEMILREGISWELQHQVNISTRVIADHIRATSFLIADGVLPSNEGRGYVLRRIMRRAIRHGKMLGLNEPFFYKVASIVIDEMSMAYPELTQHSAFIYEVIKNEETRFFATLEQGLHVLTEAAASMRIAGATQLSGAVVFRLYDTFGFPPDLTADLLREQQLTFDQAGFDVCMDAQRTLARSHWKGSGAKGLSPVYQDLQTRGAQTKFVGYSEERATGNITHLLEKGAEKGEEKGASLHPVQSKEKGASLHPVQSSTPTFAHVQELTEGAEGELILDATPFYGEQGGQIGDTGWITTDHARAEVLDTQKPYPNVVSHRVRLVKGALKIGEQVQLVVDSERRAQIRKHHTATHLLHKALRAALGEHVKQAGSLVAPDRLRFDFSHFTALTAEQLREIEIAVNRVIQSNITLSIREEAKADAIRAGAMAFFGDKYGDVVRVVEVPGYSIELCGGTHVRATGEIGGCKIIGESSVAAGVRRIEAICGRALVRWWQTLDDERTQIAQALKCAPQEIGARVQRQHDAIKQLERDVQKARAAGAGAGRGSAADQGAADDIATVNGVQILTRVIDDCDPKQLRELADGLRHKLGSGIVVLGTVRDGKANVVVATTKDCAEQYPANRLIAPIVSALGGTGGGRPDFAQGGGPNAGALAAALQAFVQQLDGQ